jgi:hypothetical protein
MTCMRTMRVLAVSDWSFGVGDPTVMGWLVCIGYFAVAYLCWERGRRCAGMTLLRSRRFWMALAILLVALGFNKQLDFQKLVTQFARAYAKEGGWYRERQSVQVALVGIALAGIAGLMAWGAFLLRRELRSTWLAMVGVVLLGVFVVIRAVSLHRLESLLYVGPIRLRDWTEPIALVLIAFAAWRARVPSRTSSQRAATGNARRE